MVIFVGSIVTLAESVAALVESGSPFIESGSPLTKCGSPFDKSEPPFVECGSPFVKWESSPFVNGAPQLTNGAALFGNECRFGTPTPLPAMSVASRAKILVGQLLFALSRSMPAGCRRSNGVPILKISPQILYYSIYENTLSRNRAV